MRNQHCVRMVALFMLIEDADLSFLKAPFSFGGVGWQRCAHRDSLRSCDVGVSAGPHAHRRFDVAEFTHRFDHVHYSSPHHPMCWGGTRCASVRASNAV